MLVRSLLLFLSILWSGSLPAQDAPARDGAPAEIRQILAGFERLPPSSRAHIETLRRELAESAERRIGHLTEGNSYPAVADFAEALMREESPESLLRLARTMENNQTTYLRFLIALFEDIGSDPVRRQKVESALAALRPHYDELKLPRTHLGTRISTFMAISAGAVGYFYSYWSGFLGTSQSNFITQNSIWLTVSIVGMLASASVNEITVLLRSLKRHLHERVLLRRGKRALADLNEILKLMRTEGFGLLTRRHLEMMKSGEFQKNRERVVIETARRLQAEQDHFGRLGLTPLMDPFFRDLRFKRELRLFSESLTQEEKIELKRELGRAAPLTARWIRISAKTRHFEGRVQAAFRAWLSEGGDGRVLRDKLLKVSEEAREAHFASARPLWSARATMWIGSVGIGLLGLHASLGPSKTVLDPIFSEPLIEAFRASGNMLYSSFAAAYFGSYFIQIIHTLQMARKPSEPLPSQRTLQSMIRILDRLEESRTREQVTTPKGPSTESGHDLIERILRDTGASTFLFCRQIFR